MFVATRLLHQHGFKTNEKKQNNLTLCDLESAQWSCLQSGGSGPRQIFSENGDLCIFFVYFFRFVFLSLFGV